MELGLKNHVWYGCWAKLHHGTISGPSWLHGILPLCLASQNCEADTSDGGGFYKLGVTRRGSYEVYLPYSSSPLTKEAAGLQYQSVFLYGKAYCKEN